MPTARKTKHTAKRAIGKKTTHAKPKTVKKQPKKNAKLNNGAKSRGKHIVVSDTRTAAKLQNAMKSGRVIILFHAEWC